MKVRVLKAFGGYRKGQSFEWSDGFARVLIARGMIEEVETASVEPRVERAAVQPTVKRKKA